MNEEFLQYIWQFQKFDHTSLQVDGSEIQVMHPGYRNTDAGPDFFNARIKIKETIWAGNVEIHVNASDWEKHNHSNDKAYENVILHVVWKNDKNIKGYNDNTLPCLCLEEHVSKSALAQYRNFMQSKQWIACENLLQQVDSFKKEAWLQRLLIERLEEKSQRVLDIFKYENNNWINTIYRFLALNMGFKLNNQAFELLANVLPFEYLAKHADNLFQLEAMIFGQAGMLNNSFTDIYPQKLKKEYEFLQQKFSLKPIDSSIWRFMRIHPNNFPTIRLAQFAAIIHNAQHIMPLIFDYTNAENIKLLFNAEASAYWHTHYLFDKPTNSRSKKLGESAISLLIINFIAPLYAAYSKAKGDYTYMEKAVDLLNNTKGEKNNIITRWGALDFNTSNAAHTQALLQLKNTYCNHKKCLQCSIGNMLLK